MANSIIDFLIYSLGVLFLVAFGVIAFIVIYKLIKEDLLGNKPKVSKQTPSDGYDVDEY